MFVARFFRDTRASDTGRGRAPRPGVIAPGLRLVPRSAAIARPRSACQSAFQPDHVTEYGSRIAPWAFMCVCMAASQTA
jgi:hypothetical protein